MDGIILVNKPKNLTSRDVCNQISKLLNVKKVGHSGTLDPFATGLMFVAVNKGTKFLPYLFEEPKTYVATLKLGNKTSTGDLTGEILSSSNIPGFYQEIVEEKVKALTKETSQIPPMTSAIHYNGKKLYELAHKGIEIERKPRLIKVFSSKLVSFNNDVIIFEVSVSKGTYVRTLGETLAESLGTVGHLIELKRTKIGCASLENAVELENIREESVISPETYLSVSKVTIDEQDAKRVFDGKQITLEEVKENKVALLYKNNVIAIYERLENGIFKSVRGLW